MGQRKSARERRRGELEVELEVDPSAGCARAPSAPGYVPAISERARARDLPRPESERERKVGGRRSERCRHKDTAGR